MLWNAFIVTLFRYVWSSLVRYFVIKYSVLWWGLAAIIHFIQLWSKTIFRNKCCISVLVIVSSLYSGINVQCFHHERVYWPFELLICIDFWGDVPPSSLEKTYPTCPVLKKFKECMYSYTNKFTMFLRFLYRKNELHLFTLDIYFYPWLVRL